MDHPISSEWDHRPEPLFEPGSLQSACRRGSRSGAAMPAKAKDFPGVTPIRPRRPIAAPTPSAALVTPYTHPVADFGPPTERSAIVVHFFHEGRWMARRQLTVQRHEEIKRRLAEGRSVREIASALKCSRRLVREIRDGQRDTHKTAPAPDPLWMSQLECPRSSTTTGSASR